MSVVYKPLSVVSCFSSAMDEALGKGSFYDYYCYYSISVALVWSLPPDTKWQAAAKFTLFPGITQEYVMWHDHMGSAWHHFLSVAGGSPHLMGITTIFCWVPLPGTTPEPFKSKLSLCQSNAYNWYPRVGGDRARTDLDVEMEGETTWPHSV